MTTEPRHTISIIVEGLHVDNVIDYEIQSSLIHPADSFRCKFPWDWKIWQALVPDAATRVLIDNTVVINGFIDGKTKNARERTIEVHGRDKAGRLVQESAPQVNYDGLTIVSAATKLVDPWFKAVTLSDTRNRNVRRGPGRKAKSARPAPLIPRQPNILFGGKSVGRGKIHPGITRWTALEQILSDLGLMAWSSADGLEFFIGQPNQDQSPQYLFLHTDFDAIAGDSTVTNLLYEIDNGDRFSLYAVVGTGGATTTDFGEQVSTRQAVVYDNPLNKVDGTGRDFIYPKRLLLPEKDFDARQDASDYANIEKIRRDFKRDKITATCPLHGQFLESGQCTLFAPDTIGRVVDHDFVPPVDELYYLVTCTYRGSRGEGETTQIEMIPQGTEIIL